MPRLRDFPAALRREGAWCYLKNVVNQVNQDNITVWAAALAYSWLFAIFPFFIFLMSLVSLLPLDSEQVRLESESFFARTLHEDAQEAMVDNLMHVVDSPRAGLLSISLIVTLWIASSGVSVTMDAMNRAYNVRRPRPFYVQRPLSILLTLIVVILILLILIILPISGFVLQWLIEQGNLDPWLIRLWSIARWVLGLFFMITVVAIIYHFGTRIRKRFRWFTPGSIFTITMWILLGLGFSFYLDRFGDYDRYYGAVGGIAILLMVFYLNALVLLIGAEINSEADFALLSEPMDGKAKPEEQGESDLPPEEVTRQP